jgi:hypothetical protein
MYYAILLLNCWEVISLVHPLTREENSRDEIAPGSVNKLKIKHVTLGPGCNAENILLIPILESFISQRCLTHPVNMTF